MGDLKDALRDAGLTPEEATEKPMETPPAPAAEQAAAEETPPAALAAEEEKKEQPCLKCGTTFTPKHPRHKLCDKCATEQAAERAAAPRPPRAPRAERPAAPASASAPAPAALAGPPVEKPCANCGAPFRPKLSKHRFCDKCAAEQPAPPPRMAAARPVFSAPVHAPAPPAPRPTLPPRRLAPVSRDIPADYLAGGYFQGVDRKHVRTEIYDAWAQPWAELLKERGLSSHQLRAFYGQVKRAQAMLEATNDFLRVQPEVLKMKPFAAARAGKPGFPHEFRDFLERNLDLVRDDASLKAFVEHFQAVVGYTAGRLRN